MRLKQLCVLLLIFSVSHAEVATADLSHGSLNTSDSKENSFYINNSQPPDYNDLYVDNNSTGSNDKLRESTEGKDYFINKENDVIQYNGKTSSNFTTQFSEPLHNPQLETAKSTVKKKTITEKETLLEYDANEYDGTPYSSTPEKESEVQYMNGVLTTSTTITEATQVEWPDEEEKIHYEDYQINNENVDNSPKKDSEPEIKSGTNEGQLFDMDMHETDEEQRVAELATADHETFYSHDLFSTIFVVVCFGIFIGLMRRMILKSIVSIRAMCFRTKMRRRSFFKYGYGKV